MPDYEPIDYRLRCHTKRTDLPADVLRDIGEAYAEITRLQQERDEARQEICIQKCDSLGAVIGGSPATPQDYAEERGWDCFKEDTND